MKTLITHIGMITLLLVSCSDQPKESALPEVKWHTAEYSLLEYSKMQPDRPILAVFTADWDLMLAMQRKFMEDDRSREILRPSGYLCLWYDMTETGSLGHSEMKRLGKVALPLTVVINGPEGGEKTYTGAFTEEEIHSFLQSIKTTKYAEQVAASDR